LRWLSIARELVLVVDFGAQYAQLIARRVREVNVYSEIVPSTISVAQIVALNPKAIILSGGPSSVYAPDAPKLDSALFDTGIPIFGICYGFQVMAAALGGEVAKTGKSEYGRTEFKVENAKGLLSGLPTQQQVWMSHGDSVTSAPKGFTTTGSTAQTPIAAFESSDGKLAGVQFHPEVLHSTHGQEILRRWLIDVVECNPNWTSANIAQEQIALIKSQVGDARAICGLSGGVDSAVAAAIVQQAIGKQLTCVFVDHGLLRSGEVEQVERDFVAATGITLKTVDAKATFLNALKGVTDPEEKRKIIGREFIRAFEAAAREIATLKFQLVEPLRALFKDEVRAVGLQLNLPEEIVWRQPFPGPGLAIRIIGEITQERLDLLREADLIVRDELHAAGLDREIWQCPVVLLADVRSVGVQGDGRTYGHPIVLRPVSSEDAMTADWSRLPYDVLAKISNRITNEVAGINRVTLDITSKPPGTIEWE